MTKPMTEQSASTKLLTLINVNQARPTKRKRVTGRDWYEVSKKVSKKSPSTPAVSLVASTSRVDCTSDTVDLPEKTDSG